MRVDVFHSLLSHAGQTLLARATREYDDHDALALGARLRRDHDPDLVAAAVSQVELRRRAVAKFGEADAARLYFTPDALEQATPSVVAALRAERMEAAGGRGLVDLGCGIGGDLIALARAGLAVTGVERDPLRAAMARANLAVLGLSGQVVEAAAEEVDLNAFDLVFVDPARRDQRGRLFDPSAYSPPWSFVERLVTTRTAGVKISPALPHRLVPPGVEAEWVSDRGEVKEAALWSGRLATTARRATVLPAAATLTATGTGSAVEVSPPATFLYEPDGAVIRAGLVEQLARSLDATVLDPHIAYLTAGHRRDTPFARCFEIVERLPYKEKALRAALRARDVGTLTVKKRGVDVAPDALRRRLGLRGSRPATLVLTRTSGSAVALLVRPVSSPAG